MIVYVHVNTVTLFLPRVSCAEGSTSVSEFIFYFYAPTVPMLPYDLFKHPRFLVDAAEVSAHFQHTELRYRFHTFGFH